MWYLVLFAFGFTVGLLIAYVGLSEDNHKLEFENRRLTDEIRALKAEIISEEPVESIDVK